MESNTPKTNWIVLPNMHTVLLLSVFVLILVVIEFPVQRSPRGGEAPKKEITEAKPIEHFVPAPKVNAQAYVVIDIAKNKQLFGKNEHTALPLASLTKLMTTLAAAEIFASSTPINTLGTFAPNESLTNSVLNFKDFASYVLTVSSNAGAAAIATTANKALSKTGEGFLQKMNTLGESLGMTETYFLNASGLDDSEALNGGYGSASDVARLLVAAQKQIPDILSATAKPQSDFASQNGAWIHAQNTNLAIPDIPGLIGGKTGFTDIAGGNLAILFDADIGRPVAIIVLGSSKEGRFEDVTALVHASLEKIHGR